MYNILSKDNTLTFIIDFHVNENFDKNQLFVIN